MKQPVILLKTCRGCRTRVMALLIWAVIDLAMGWGGFGWDQTWAEAAAMCAFTCRRPVSPLCSLHYSDTRDLKIRGRRRQRKRRLKVNSRSFNLHRDFSKSLTLWNVGEPSQSWISKNHIQVQKERGSFVVACVLPLYIVKLGIFTS